MRKRGFKNVPGVFPLASNNSKKSLDRPLWVAYSSLAGVLNFCTKAFVGEYGRYSS
jgi:hypothetical protein